MNAKSNIRLGQPIRYFGCSVIITFDIDSFLTIGYKFSWSSRGSSYDCSCIKQPAYSCYRGAPSVEECCKVLQGWEDCGNRIKGSDGHREAVLHLPRLCICSVS